MSDSILNTTKKVLGVAETYTEFDTDIVMHINSALSTLTQLGIGPVGGFSIEDAAAEWATLLGGDPRYNPAKTYVYLRVRRLFDPPQTSYHMAALNEQIQELEWRLNVTRETDSTLMVGIHKKITGNLGDEFTLRLGNPSGQTVINATGTYEASFVGKDGKKRSVVLDTSQKAAGVLFLPIVIRNGTYTVRSLDPARTILTVDVSVQ